MAIGSALVTGAFGLGGALLANKGNKEAASAQERAHAASLAFAREQEAARRSEYNERVSMQRAAHDSREAALAPFRQAAMSALAKRYGISLPAQGMTLGQMMGRRTAPQRAVRVAEAPVMPGAMPFPPQAGPVAPPVDSMPPGGRPPMTLGDVSGWNDWKRYGA